jgi:mRNA-degrading endonuclease HigB of HigAB toxin-antitoxin module
MNQIVLRKELENLLLGGQAFVTFDQAVKNVKKASRNKRLSKEIHSVWENLEHMRIAQEDILKYCINPDWKSPEWPKGYWPAGNGIIDDNKWNATTNSFINDRQELIKLVQNEKIELISVIPHTKEHTYLREILIAAEHNAYHIGQIVIARKLLNDWPS